MAVDKYGRQIPEPGKQQQPAAMVNNPNQQPASQGLANVAQQQTVQPGGNLRGASVWDNVKNTVQKAGRDFDKAVVRPFVQGVTNPGKAIEQNITKPIVSGVKDVGRAIEEGVTEPFREAVGIDATPVPAGATPKIDPTRKAAMDEYGRMVTNQAGQFNPAAYGPNTFQARTMTPQITSNERNIPGIYSPAARTPTVPGQVAAPDLRNVSGQAPALRDMTTGNMANTYRQENVLAEEMARLSHPTQLASGYSPEMREKYISNATSGLEQQREAAAARLKEEQMSAGNYGSSVGQKNMADLMADYDRQMMQASTGADLMQMEAEREDRYKNIGVDQNRTGLLTNVAGAGANMNLASTGFNRDTTAMQNNVEQVKAEYARQGIQIDNETAMALAQFGSGQQQQQFGNQMAATDMTNAQGLTSYGSQWDRYGAQANERQRGDQIANAGQQFNIGQQDAADVRNYGVYQDATRGLAAYGANTVDPQSQLNYEMWLEQERQKAVKQGNAMNALGQTVGMFAGGI